MKNKKGFTLIEMAVVLLVIGILAGIVLRNIGSQPAAARDTRRLGDLRNTANYLSIYLAKFGYFPSSTTWSNLETELRRVGVVDRLPRDPSGKDYDYYPCTDTRSTWNNVDYRDINHFILRAQLEQTASSAPRLWETSVTGTPPGWACAGTLNCNPAQRYYCVAQ
jgi:general secretion pathway protein G